MAADESTDRVVLGCERVSKVFPGTQALSDITYEVHAGVVNVLVGENGAGKSTLMKILAGVYRPTTGTLVLDGQPVSLHSPRDAERLGIGLIYQELNLCPNLSVAENIFLGREITRRGRIDRSAQCDEARELTRRLGNAIDPDTLVSELPIGQQQVVEIAKALAKDVRILIMDEPTSALSTAEVDQLLAVIRDLKASGVAVVYISHRLDETLEIGDRISVFRDGRMVAHASTDEVDVPWIVDKMVGKDVASLFTKQVGDVGDELFRVEDITLFRHGRFVVDRVSFSLRAGQVVGVYGLMGAGRTELFECLAGRHADSTGRVFLDGVELTRNQVRARIDAGIVLAPEDRQRDGLVQPLSVADNMLLASLDRWTAGPWPFLGSRQRDAAVRAQVKDLAIRLASPTQVITSLSGGNQQKVVIAKALLTEPEVLLLDEPSRGIDVNAKAEIFGIIAQLASQGFGVLFTSSDLKEVLAMADRVIVMNRGRLTGDFGRNEATEARLVAASTASVPEPDELSDELSDALSDERLVGDRGSRR